MEALQRLYTELFYIEPDNWPSSLILAEVTGIGFLCPCGSHLGLDLEISACQVWGPPLNFSPFGRS